MSPIFVRPVREQLEHDRLIRFLQAKYKRKFDVAINVGDEQVAPVKIGTATFFPDLVLTDGKKLAGVVEVESGESVNNLEAMAQWVHFSQDPHVPFHLYVPVQAYDAARRLCDANKVSVGRDLDVSADGRWIRSRADDPRRVGVAGAFEQAIAFEQAGGRGEQAGRRRGEARGEESSRQTRQAGQESAGEECRPARDEEAGQSESGQEVISRCHSSE